MRLLLWILLIIFLTACDPNPVKAEGTLHPPSLLPDGSRPLYRPQHPCTPGQNATDPDCAQAKLDDCLGECQHDFKYNGDVMYLRWCERECGERRERFGSYE